MSKPRRASEPREHRLPPLPGPARRRFGYDDLDTDKCQDLLALHSIGRIAWTAADGPQLFPVSYTWVPGLIIFRTSPYGILSELVQRTVVVFEVDETDQTNRVGWSVIVRGRAAGIAFPDHPAQPLTMNAVPWASGHRNLVIGVTPTQITGRRFGPVADSADGPSTQPVTDDEIS